MSSNPMYSDVRSWRTEAQEYSTRQSSCHGWQVPEALEYRFVRQSCIIRGILLLANICHVFEFTQVINRPRLDHDKPAHNTLSACSLHELARNVEQAADTTGASSTCPASTSLALHVELEGHLGRLGNSILLGSTLALHLVSHKSLSFGSDINSQSSPEIAADRTAALPAPLPFQ